MTETSIFGSGKLKELKSLLEKWNPRKVFVVTGKSSYEDSGIKSKLEKILEGRELFRHSEFDVNPKLQDLVKVAKKFRDFVPDVMIAIGGGSVLDTAKLLSILPADKARIIDIIKGGSPVPERKIPFIAIPTTAGSGSECTHFAVAYVGETKYSVASNLLLPDYSIVDPELTYTMPRYLTAVTAFDAFSQAVESHWSVASNPESRAYSTESIRNIIEVFNQLIDKPDKNNREKMMKAAHLAGRAINITKTTGPHALSYALTMNHDIPHGYAVILTLPGFFIHNANVTKDRINPRLSFKDHQKRISELCELLQAGSNEDAVEKIQRMVRDAGLSTKLSKAGVENKQELEKVVDSVNLERLRNNPAVVSKNDLRLILQTAY